MQLHASALGVGAETAVQLIAAPGAGKRITVLGFVVSVGGTATNVSLIDSLTATNTKQWVFAANQHAESGIARWELTDNAALNYTTSASGPSSIEIDYVVEATGGTGN
jgi:uncharacterized protein YfaQ (DUF2300 family)